jgi:alpha-galactosidase
MHRQAEAVVIQAGMANLSLSLQPGESFRQPTILLGRYQGDAATGQRALRTHLRDRVQLRLGGAPMRPVSFWDSYYGDRGQFFEKDALEEIPLVAQAGIEYFVIDGGWNGGGQDGQFESLIPHIGSWQVSRDKFPNGFAPLKDAAARHGIKLGLWFDIERAHRDSRAAKEHPDLFFSDWEGNGCRLLKLNQLEAREWAVETISKQVRALEARWIRFDMNCDPAECWAKHDAQDRHGETEIRYVENLYGLLDTLLDRFPDLVIENCASGGRRIDLETIRRSHTDWISDHTQSEALIRYHLHGACRWLPANRLNTSMAHAYLEPNRPVNWREPLPAGAYLSHFGGNFSVSDRLKPLTEAARVTLRQYVDLFARTRSCFAGDVYALGRQCDTLDGPAGLAAVDPATGNRVVMTFGVTPQVVPAFVPDDFKALVSKPPVVGDSGTDQFTSAYLWHG